MSFIESNWTYDKIGRVTSQVVQQGLGGTQQVARQDLTYLGNDDISTLQHWLGSSNHKQFNYTFDLRHQLLGVTETAAGGAFNAVYGYGAAGRFSSANVSGHALPGSDVKTRNVTYAYGDADKERPTALMVGSTAYASYTYDDAGNQIQRAYPGTNETWDYVYDGKDQLRRATKKVGGTVTGSEEYWYASGARVAVLKRDASGTKTELIWFLGDTEAHYEGSGSLDHVYSHLSLGTPVARVDRTGNTSTSLEFQFHGLASNTLATVDQSGTINASFDYAPYGEIVESTDAGSASGAGVAAHRRRLNDKYVDELTDLGYYGARFYDKTLMGWTQSDPLYRFAPDAGQLGSPRKAVLYGFSLNNPVRYLDPDGRDTAGPLSGYRSEFEQRQTDIRAIEKGADDPEQWLRAEAAEVKESTRQDPPDWWWWRYEIVHDCPFTACSDEQRQFFTYLARSLRPLSATWGDVYNSANDYVGELLGRVADGSPIGQSAGHIDGWDTLRMLTLFGGGGEPSAGEQIVYRQLSYEDRLAFDVGENLVAKTEGGTVAMQVSGQPTRFISSGMSTAAIQRFASGNGLVAISVAIATKLGAGFVEHNNVLQAVRREFGNGIQLQNAISAQEVMFRDFIPQQAMRLIGE
jgi:RHS repeat-associated protein